MRFAFHPLFGIINWKYFLGDIFGAALLSIPTNTTTPSKKRSTSSKSSVYQDSPSSTLSPQRNSVDVSIELYFNFK